MTAAGIYDFIVEQGAGFDRTFTYRNKNNEDGTPGDPINLTGYTAKMQARLRYDNENELIDLTTENGGIVLGGVAGTVRVVIGAENTSELNFTKAEYDIFLYPPEGEPEKFLKGEITLERSDTK